MTILIIVCTALQSCNLRQLPWLLYKSCHDYEIHDVMVTLITSLICWNEYPLQYQSNVKYFKHWSYPVRSEETSVLLYVYPSTLLFYKYLKQPLHNFAEVYITLRSSIYRKGGMSVFWLVSRGRSRHPNYPVQTVGSPETDPWQAVLERCVNLTIDYFQGSIKWVMQFTGTW